MFRKLCGPDPIKNVVIASTLWGKISDQEANAHECELTSKPNYRGDMIDHGVQPRRFLGIRQSALDVILEFGGSPTVTLDLGLELVDKAKAIAETNANIAVNGELYAMERIYSSDLKQLREETAQALAEKDTGLYKTIGK